MFGTMKQPDPEPVDGPEVLWMVVADLEARIEVGVETYGQPLRPFNGRDPLLDAYHEALDLSLYLRQALYEREHPPLMTTVRERGVWRLFPAWIAAILAGLRAAITSGRR